LSRRFDRLAVFCGSAGAAVPRYGPAARSFGRFLAESGIGLVYGGGSVGLMQQLAEGALSEGGEVIGVIPRKLLDLELGHSRLSRLEVVASMHERKQRMADLADGFVALPGGYGTLDELFEALTWTQLRYHDKPVGLLDVGGFWRPLEALVDHLATEGFVRPLHRTLLVSATDPAQLLQRMSEVVLPDLERWIDQP
jgi:uncharacterized protein (TIGR00730 family)